MINKRYLLLLIFVVLLITGKNYSQSNNQSGDNNVIQTPVPFLNIAPDACGSSLGDIGVATKPDINSMHWNSAKYAFIKDDFGVSLSYTPWLRGIANDIGLMYFSGLMRLDKQQTVAAAIRYFSLGEVIFTDEVGKDYYRKIPNEFSIDVAYSRLFSERMSGGIAFRFIRSDLSVGSGGTSGNVSPSIAGMAFASDVGLYYHKPIQFNKQPSDWSWGVNISNMGSKISYTKNGDKYFIPINLRIGTALETNLDLYNKLTIALDLNKLLVPTPPIRDSIDGQWVVEKGMDDNVSVPQGMLQSFFDAPGGLTEELKEIMISVGCEYLYREQFAIRCGYFHESKMKGNRQYVTLGIGLRMTVLSFDFSYLIPTAFRNSPLANTMRLTANYNIGKPKRQQNNK